MTIILFLVDTSASMCQKAYVNGVQKTYLDIAKGAVETFLKFRQRTQDCLGDRYMLLTFEEPPANIKAGWKENHATFMNELKNLQSFGLTTMGESLKNAFDLLNLNRMQSGIDTYGQGRCPFYLEPSVIIVITDGGKYTYRNGVHPEIILPLSTQIPGTKFTKEPFRWDQRLFSLVLRMPGNKIEERIEGKVPHDESPIERMCEVTGGRSYHVRSHYVLNQCLESLVQKVQPGVVLQFEPMLPKEGTTETQADIVFPTTKKMIYVQKHISQKTFPIGYWPLPEPYWPDPKAIILHPRDAHPKLKVVTTAVDEPQMVRSFPVDKYEIEACPMTFQILQKREINKCWQVIISNGMHGFELPFGYLKASPNFTQVHLYVLAYNYPALLPLLHDLIHKYNMSPPNDLMYKFNAYVRSIPPYYSPFLRKVLHNLSVPYPLMQFMLPENIDNYLSPAIANQLKLIKNTAKQDQENLCLKVFKQLKQPKPPYRQVETAKLNTGVPLRRDLVRHPLLRDTFAKMHAELEPLENFTVIVPQLTRQSSAKSYRNPFDIPRRDLIEEIARMRETFLRPIPTSLVAKDSGHCLPISEMGNYQEYLKNKDNPLREIEPTNVRQHMFGNPYKKDKHMVMVDEADLGEVAPIKTGGNAVGGSSNGMHGVGGNQNLANLKKLDSRARKRKAGPIRKDYIFRRLLTDNSRSSSPALSTSSSTSHSSMGTFPTSGASCYANSNSSMSDYDSDNISDTSSVCSGMSDDSDPGQLVMSFDFNEEENVESDFPLNGYVRNFINGINTDENSINNHNCQTEMAVNSMSNNTTNNNNNNNNINNNNSHSSSSSSSSNNSPAIVNMTSVNTVGNAHILLTTNSNGNLTVPVVPSSPPNSPQHPYINNYGTQNSMITPMQQDAYGANVNMALAGNGVTNLTGTPTVSGIYYAPQVHNQHNINNGNIYGGMPTMGVMSSMVQPNVLNASPIIMYNQPQGQHLQPQITLQQQHQQSTTTTSSLLLHHTHLQQQQQQQQIVTASTTSIGTIQQSQQQQVQPPQQMQIQQQPTTQHHTIHNDINDAQEISRILQQCHNGNSSNNNLNSKNNINNNEYINTTTAAAGTTTTNNLDTELMPPPIGNNLEHLKSAYDSGNLINNHTNIMHNNIHNNNNNNHNINNISNNNHNNNNRVLSTSNSLGLNNHNSQQTSSITTATAANTTTTAAVILNQQQRLKQESLKKSVKPNKATSAPPPAPFTEEQRDAARKHNLEIRTLIFRDIRKPGRNYTQLLDHLNLVKGDYDMKSSFVDMCIYESMRFRRQQMVKSIENWWNIKKKTLLHTTKPTLKSNSADDS